MNKIAYKHHVKLVVSLTSI